ncbi:MAG: hypothetical protein EHM58_07130 [Ignavibacteriae bacterium]|nr:MAG: hypothetical protein EHM58_07130 [Ignavibacteriota bacterium]
MNKRIIIISSVIFVLVLGLLYINFNNLIAGDKDGKTCNSTAGCTPKSSDIKADNDIRGGSEFAVYEFVTDKAYNDEMKSSLKSELLNVAGVKDVKFSKSCGYSKVTNVSISYASGETSEETLASFVKDKNYDCSGQNGNCPEKNTKSSKETRKI